MPAPVDPKIYHIVHVDRLPSIVAEVGLLCDAAIAERRPVGTTTGMNDIKQRRLSELRLSSHGDLRWAFTLSNAGARYFEDRSDLGQLGEIDWDAVEATHWSRCKEGKQAEFLIEQRFPWELVSRIGVRSQRVCYQTEAVLEAAAHRPPVEIRPAWYY